MFVVLEASPRPLSLSNRILDEATMHSSFSPALPRDPACNKKAAAEAAAYRLLDEETMEVLLTPQSVRDFEMSSARILDDAALEALFMSTSVRGSPGCLLGHACPECIAFNDRAYYSKRHGGVVCQVCILYLYIQNMPSCSKHARLDFLPEHAQKLTSLHY